MHPQVTVHFRHVEHMQRPVAVVGEEIRHIDKEVDRTQPNRAQLILQPLRTRAVLDPANDAPTEKRTTVQRVFINGDRHLRREGSRHDINVVSLERAQATRREIARDPLNPQRVWTVRRDRDLDDRVDFGRVIVRQPIDKALTHLTRRKLNDPVMLVRQFQFAFRGHHPVAFDTANIADAQCDIDARHVIARLGQNDGDPFPRIRRTAHDLLFTFVCRHTTHAQTVCIRVLLRMRDFRKRKRFQLVRRVFNAFDLKPEVGERIGDLIDACRGIEMCFEPGEREFHVSSSCRAGSCTYQFGSVGSKPTLRVAGQLSPACNVGTSSAAKP